MYSYFALFLRRSLRQPNILLKLKVLNSKGRLKLIALVLTTNDKETIEGERDRADFIHVQGVE